MAALETLWRARLKGCMGRIVWGWETAPLQLSLWCVHLCLCQSCTNCASLVQLYFYFPFSFPFSLQYNIYRIYSYPGLLLSLSLTVVITLLNRLDISV
jgi:hypothetical protein